MALAEGQRGERFPHPFRPATGTADEHRHVSPQGQTERRQPVDAQIEPPKPIQGHQHGRGIRRTAAEPTPNRDTLFDGDVNAMGDFGRIIDAIRLGTQSLRRPDHEVFCRVQRVGRSTEPLNAPVVPGAEPDRVAPIEQLEDCLQRVVAVGAAPGDGQEQIQLGWGWKRPPARAFVGWCAHSVPTFHSLTTSRTEAPSAAANTRRGSGGSPGHQSR